MNDRDLSQRTKEFALRIIRLYVALPKTTEAQVLGKQVLRSGTSVGAKLNAPSLMRTSLAKLRVDCKNLKKQVIG